VLTKLLQTLFKNFIAGFKGYNLEQVSACYHIPCTLNMPDNIIFVNNEQGIANELSLIFTQLKQAKANNIKAVKASYQLVAKNIVLVSIDWHFIDESNQLFADFCGVYHIQINGEKLKIINVASHELANSLNLENALTLDH